MSNSEFQGELNDRLPAVERNDSDECLPLVYQKLRRLAALWMARESDRQTLQATALVHEAWLRLSSGPPRVWRSQSHFFGAAAEAMRRILIERARRKMTLKRGSRPEIVQIEDVEVAETLPDERVLLIDEALTRLQTKNPELARVVVLKFFGGLTNAEVAEMLTVTERTVQSKWTYAKAWLLENIREEHFHSYQSVPEVSLLT